MGRSKLWLGNRGQPWIALSSSLLALAEKGGIDGISRGCTPGVLERSPKTGPIGTIGVSMEGASNTIGVSIRTLVTRPAC
jgi:hypothetical protein